MAGEDALRKYLQLQHGLTSHGRELPSEAVLPTERELAARHGVSLPVIDLCSPPSGGKVPARSRCRGTARATGPSQQLMARNQPGRQAVDPSPTR